MNNLPFLELVMPNSYIQQRLKERENIVRSILEKHFRVNANDDDALKELVKSKNMAILYSRDNEILGITANNRWLYTINGKIIGKKGKRYKIEEL